MPPKPIAFLNPFTNAENAYIEHQKQLLRELGWEVRPLSLMALLEGRCWGLASRRNAVLVHWLENRLFTLHAVERGLHGPGLVQFALYTLVLKLSRAQVVYVVHDHAVHDVLPSVRGLSRAAIGLMRRIADTRIVHDPSFAERYAASYVPHPLLWDAESSAQPPREDTHAQPRFLAAGALRPYKSLHVLLERWPHGVPLTIVGKGEPEYVERLREVVERRELHGTVDLRPGFVPDEELAAVMRAHDVMILPHRTAHNLVSGAFFLSVGQLPVILARRTPFIAWAQQGFPGVYTFDADDEILAQVERIQRDWPRLRGEKAAERAIAAFGKQACREGLTRALGGTLPEPARAKDAHAASGGMNAHE